MGGKQKTLRKLKPLHAFVSSFMVGGKRKAKGAMLLCTHFIFSKMVPFYSKNAYL